ncbi:NB-ARC domain-containing protein [Sphaerisporangium viridialbum]|uniref:NB-ARC domain-containing protein n=1 Tax=Sphaerisporangium viridialbum TaxID=46189 RepID=UPI003C7338DE
MPDTEEPAPPPAVASRIVVSGLDTGTATSSDARGAQGVQIGDGNVQYNVFAPSAEIRRPRMVPEPTGPVVDRPELAKELLAALIAADTGPHGMLVAVEGPGGFGKTTLAAKACRDLRIAERYPGGVLWATVGERRRDGRLAELVSGLCEVLSGEPVRTTDPLIAGGRLGSLLDAHDPILLVVDDVWTTNQLAPFMIGGGDCRRLITTRNAGVAPRGAATVLVDRMTAEQAAAALTEGVSGLPRDLLSALVAATGRWPLLLGLVNAALIEHLAAGAGVRAAVDWMLRHLAAAGPAAFDRNLGDQQDRSQAVEATMAASLAVLDPLDRQRFFDLAVVPENAELPAQVSRWLWQVAGGLSEAAAEKLRSLLVRLRLVQEVWTSAGPAIRLHDVVRAYLIHRLTADELRARHELMVRVAREALVGEGTPDIPWWTLPADDAYLWRYLPHHMAEAGRVAERDTLVRDLRWVSAKTVRSGSSVPAEVDLAEATPEVPALRHALGRLTQQLTITDPPTALGATLYAYLGSLPELDEVVASYGRHLTGPQLTPHWPLPDRPGSGPYRVISGHEFGLSGCVFSPDGTLIATSSHDRTIRVWAAATGEQRQILTGSPEALTGCAFSPDGTMLAGAGHDGTVRLWNVAGGPVQRVLDCQCATVTGCAFSPDGALLAGAGGDGSVRLWDVATGEQVRVLAGHEGAVRGCAFSPDGELVLTAGEDRTARLWETATGEQVRVLAGHEGAVRGCAFSPDGELVLTAGEDRTARLWETATGIETDVLTGHTETVTGCTFSPDGTLLATGSHDSTVRTWYVASGAEHGIFADHTEGVTGCAFSPDGTLLASTGFDWHLRLWRVDEEPGTATASRQWVYGAAFAPGGDLLLTSGHDHQAHLQTTETGETIRVFDGHTDTVAACAVSPDGGLAATAGYDGYVRLWDIETGEARAVLTGHADLVHDCAFDPSGAMLATVGHDETIHLWTVAGGTPHQVLTGHDGAIAACAFSPDGGLLATASHDQTLRLWDPATGDLRAVLAAHTDIVTGCAFSPDGRRLASTSHDRTVRVWDVRTARLRQTLRGHSGGVSACAFTSDGGLLASAGYDRQIRVWETNTYRQVCALRVAAPLLRLAWHPTEPLLALTGQAGVYLLRYLPNGVRGQ